MRVDSRGFSLIESAVVCCVVAATAIVGAPIMEDLVLDLAAAELVLELDSIRSAALDTRLTVGHYPATGRWGEIPEPIGSRVRAITFARPEMTYLWWAPGASRGVAVYAPARSGVLRRAADRWSGRAFWCGDFAFFVIDDERPTKGSR